MSGKTIRRRYFLRYLPAIVAGLALLGAGSAWARPHIYLQGRVPFYIERPTVRAIFALEGEREDRTGPFVNIKKDTVLTTQKLDIRTRGFVYHPKLLVFDAALRPEFRQRSVDADTGYKESVDGKFLGYSLDTQWLRDKPYKINLFASRDRQDVSNTLAADTLTKSTVYRGRLVLDYPVLPTTLTAQKQDFTTKGFYRSQNKQDSIVLEADKQTQKSDSNLRFDIRSIDRVINTTTQKLKRSSGYITNDYRVSNTRRLRSNLRYADVSTERLGYTTTDLESRFEMDHRRHFRSSYGVFFNQRDDLDFSSKNYGLSAGVSHQLYENLTTSLNLSGNQSQANTGDLDNYDARLGLRYKRHIPWGQLQVNFDYRQRIRDDQRTGKVAFTSAERHLFKGAAAQVFLENRNIDTGSIVVTNAAGTLVYVEGIDYSIDTVGATVRITRDPFAGIGDDEAVLVDYSYVPDPPAKTGLGEFGFGVNLRLWEMLELYYRRNRANERQISGQFPVNLVDDTLQTAGAELDLKWSRTRFEVEDRDTTISPFRRWLVSEALSFRPHRNIGLGLGGAYTETTLKDTGEITKGTSANASLSWHVSSTGRLQARAFWRRLRSSVQRTDSTGVIATYDWWFGAWRPQVRYEYLDDENGVSGELRKRHSIFLRIERFFR